MNVRVTYLRLLVPCVRRCSIRVGRVKFCVATVSPLCLIEETVPNTILTNLTVRVTNLEDVDKVAVEELDFRNWLPDFINASPKLILVVR